MSSGSRLPALSAVVLGTIFLLLSCGSSLRPDHLDVYLPERYVGTVHINVCVSNAPSKEITLDAQGVGATSLCPGVNTAVELRIIQNDRQIKLAQKEVRIRRTGDGVATSIEARIEQ